LGGVVFGEGNDGVQSVIEPLAEPSLVARRSLTSRLDHWNMKPSAIHTWP
jgi:hypothetical protein